MLWTRQTTATGYEFDPVCGATVEALESFDGSVAIHYAGHEYVFCSPKCRGMFVETPTRFATSGGGGCQEGLPPDDGR
jgi:YHS domain-containing protein